MEAIDLDSGQQLAGSLAVAETLLTRMRGLLGRSDLPPGSGLWIKRCCSIHTFGMRFAIDAIFLDRQKRVVGIAKGLAPNRISRFYPGASSVLELPAGTLDSAATVLGNQIAVRNTRPASEAALNASP